MGNRREELAIFDCRRPIGGLGERTNRKFTSIANDNGTQKITPFLWFDGRAEEAMNFYGSIFPGFKVLNVSRYGEGAPGVKGSVMTATFTLHGQEFIALNGGPHFKFTEAISLFVKCESQGEVDERWAKLSAGGSEGKCGWLKDKFGISWQIVPTMLGEVLGGKDAGGSKRAMMAMLQMKKLDIAGLKRAYEGE